MLIIFYLSIFIPVKIFNVNIDYISMFGNILFGGIFSIGFSMSKKFKKLYWFAGFLILFLEMYLVVPFLDCIVYLHYNKYEILIMFIVFLIVFITYCIKGTSFAYKIQSEKYKN
jgi:hypothetical protein